ncbi:MAG: ATPase, T2SS/T4P/T4SS family [Candidatus Thorarchaeota archaeon]
MIDNPKVRDLMMKRIIEIINCPESRCDSCQHASASLCRKMLQIRESNPDCRIAFFESKRRLMYLASESQIQPVGPPWYSNGWESIYLGHNDVTLDFEKIIDVYFVGPYTVLFRNDDDVIIQQSIPRIQTELEYDLYIRLYEDLIESDKMNITSRIKLNDKISQFAETVSSHIIDFIPEIRSNTRLRLSNIISQQFTVLGPITPIILDDEVEEIFLDRPDTSIYFDHRRFGRCYSSETLDNIQVARMITFLRAESNMHMDRRNPSIKIDVEFFEIPLRFSASLPPLTPDGFHMQIRRAKHSPFSVLDLIINGTIPVEAAAMLILAINSRMNITITGEPGVGKTTLLNALDMITPQKWRKIYVEDVIESRIHDNHHQVRLRVNPIDEMANDLDKSTEIAKTLHRSPDYLILGEIQTEGHSNALFQALSAGLRSIQTCHSGSASDLVTRWTRAHNIPISNLALMDVIVTLDRPKAGESTRIIREIVEVRRNTIDGIKHFIGLNKLYDWVDNIPIFNCVQDGAYQLRANNVGTEDSKPAYDAIIEILKHRINSGNLGNLSSIGELLWSSGHPMKFEAINS